ncbi:hypothetical protein CLNEO_19780 [Anaerotignum neopropionicum]|uniref:DUF2971 domain-containing protein n=2 Tax=Anaerotignum neopropionicum TaxID=36847 RepID=A0A136WE05_9FIRM|nr:DUF2971 domain-containing protein [Anaerotignum neopropionicum]KXL52569.1 hypothetical protein CLNEO_19780 [Anaerotignum neopropionicum]
MGMTRKTRYLDEWIHVPLCNIGEKLFHYTTAEGVQGIVENKQFIATKSDFLNDKLEFVYSLEVLNKLIDTYIVDKEFGRRLYRSIKDEMDELAIITPSCETFCVPEKEHVSFYVVAFSKQENSALLWAEFTDFKGYCLGFDYEKLVRGFSGRSFLHGTVIYDEEAQVTCLLEALLSCIRTAVEQGFTEVEGFFDEATQIGEEALTGISKDMAMICSVYAMFFKGEFFKGEEEYRFVFSPLIDERGGRPRFRILDQMFLPYIMVEFDGADIPIPLESVTVGAKNNSDIAVRGVRSFLMGQGLSIPVKLSDIPLRY